MTAGQPKPDNARHLTSRPGWLGSRRLAPTRLSPDRIVPRNAVWSPAKLADLERSIRASGWVGRPLVAVEVGRRVQAVTGSHRIYAARVVGLASVPVVVVRDGTPEHSAFTGGEGWSVRSGRIYRTAPIADRLRRLGAERLAALLEEG